MLLIWFFDQGFVISSELIEFYHWKNLMILEFGQIYVIISKSFENDLILKALDAFVSIDQLEFVIDNWGFLKDFYLKRYKSMMRNAWSKLSFFLAIHYVVNIKLLTFSRGPTQCCGGTN